MEGTDVRAFLCLHAVLDQYDVQNSTHIQRRRGKRTQRGEQECERKRSKVTMIVETSTTIQPPAIQQVAWQTGDIKYRSCGYGRTPPPSLNDHGFPNLMQQRITVPEDATVFKPTAGFKLTQPEKILQ